MAKRSQGKSRPVHLVPKGGLDRAPISDVHRKWADANGFTGKAGQMLVLPDADGNAVGALFGEGEAADRSRPGNRRPGEGIAGRRMARRDVAGEPVLAAIGLALGSYRFDRYRSPSKSAARFDPLKGADTALVERTVSGVTLARDLINTPTNDMGPADLEAAARTLGQGPSGKGLGHRWR